MNTLVENLKNCKKCQLCQSSINKEKGIPVGWGSGNKVFIIGLAPSDSRDKAEFAMKPVSELDNANLIIKCLEDLNLTEKDFYISNLIKCSFPNNVLEEKYFDICFNNWLFRELVSVSPKTVICLGKSVYEYISQKEFLSQVFTFYQVYHPAYIAKDKSKYGEWVDQWKRILSS